MNFSTFVEKLETVDEATFKSALGITQKEFESLYTTFQTCKDLTWRLTSKQKLYGILIYKNWNLTPKDVGSIILDAPKDYTKAGNIFIQRVGKRLADALVLVSKDLQKSVQTLAKNKHNKVNTLDEIFEYCKKPAVNKLSEKDENSKNAKVIKKQENDQDRLTEGIVKFKDKEIQIPAKERPYIGKVNNFYVNLNYEFEENDINAILNAKIAEVHLNDSMEVLAAGDNIVPGKLKEIIEEYLSKITEQNKVLFANTTLLIPYNLDNTHWVGIVIHLNEQAKPYKIVYADSLKAESVPEALEEELKEIMPDVGIEIVNHLIQPDGTSCGLVTIYNLFTLAQQQNNTPLAQLTIDQIATMRAEVLERIQLSRPDFFDAFYIRQLTNKKTVANLSTQFMLQGLDKNTLNNLHSSKKIKAEDKNLHFKKEKETTSVKPPKFVISTIAYVPSDTETSSSEDSGDEAEFSFEEEDFEDPPFEIQTDKRGKLEPELICKFNQSSNYKSKVVQPLLQKLEQEGFADEEDNGTEKAKTQLSVSFGLNRPYSLSSGKNKVLKRELNATINTSVPHKRFGLFWSFPWVRKDNTSAEKRRQPLTYEEVRSFYKQLKERDPEKAREFRRSQENQGRNGMVPYRELRETTKNHAQTRMLVVDARNKNGGDIYLSFIDKDTDSFKVKQSGIYKAYTKMHAEFAAPTIMSTGYEYICKHLPMLTLACELDRRVREATAAYVPLGIYYPEPNFIVKVLEEKDTVEESFYELKANGEINHANYTSPQEAPLLLEKVAQRKDSDKPYFALYKSQNPLGTQAPTRATQNKVKTALKFTGTKNKHGKFIDWTEQDIKQITRNIAQSHVSPFAWATNLLNAFQCASQVQIGSVLLKDQGKIRRITISLLTRLYSKYDPLSLFKNNGGKKHYQQNFHQFLENLDTSKDEDKMQAKSRSKKKAPLPPPLTKKQRKNTKNTKAEKDGCLSTADELTSVAELKELLGKLLSNADVNMIEKAAKASGKAIRDTLLEFLEFPKPAQTVKPIVKK